MYKGYITYPNFKVEVAIKSCTRASGFDDIEREARVFLKLKERHMNIVNLLGMVWFKMRRSYLFKLLFLSRNMCSKQQRHNSHVAFGIVWGKCQFKCICIIFLFVQLWIQINDIIKKKDNTDNDVDVHMQSQRFS